MIRTITLLHRAKNDGISIQKVFKILFPYLKEGNDLTNVYMPFSGIGIRQLITNLKTAYTWRKKSDVIHITGAIHYLSFILKKEKTITTVHDLGMLDKGNKIHKLLLKILFLYSLKRNRFIVCISKKTKDDVLALINYPEENILVIPDPISDKYNFIQKEFNKTRPRILHIGTKENKNLHRTIQSLKGLNIHLHIVGKLSEKDVTILKENKISYSNNFNISEEQLIDEYYKCDILSFISTYEGFGMPIIEAQAIGRVCITSNIEPMKSVAAEGAVVVDPYNINQITDAFREIIINDNYRNKIIAAGYKNSLQYKAPDIADKYRMLYEKIYSVS